MLSFEVPSKFHFILSSVGYFEYFFGITVLHECSIYATGPTR